MDLFDLVAKITLDSSEYENELKRTNSGVGSFSSAWAKAGKATVAAIGAATVAIGALTKSAVQSYAEYEQLAGGVKKLYGDASDELMKYAEQGYKTAGMSSIKYMELATSFSASLINSLDGDTSKAAKQTDVAMRAISDNFNTFGGDIQNVQNAFQGFAKGQFNMLDNLRLGYGGTKSEMERLIEDANKYAEANGMAADLSIDSFSDIVTAIDLIQQKQGIAGTTAKEAATTIEGSLNMTKAAWENLVAGFANPDADLGKLMDDLVVAIVGENEGEGLLNQITPAIQRAMEGIGKLIENAAPILADQLPSVVETMLPPLISAAISLVTGLVNALPSILQVLVAQMPMIMEMLVNAITQSLPMLVSVAPQLVIALAQGISQSLPTLIPSMIEAIVTMVTALLDNIDLLISAAGSLMTAFSVGLVRAIPTVLKKVPTIIKRLFNALVKSGARLLSAGISVIRNFGSGIVRGFASIPSKVASLARKIPSSIRSGIGNLASIGRSVIDGLWSGLREKWNSLISWFSGAVDSLKDKAKRILNINSPSKVFMEIGKSIPEGLALGIEKNMGLVYDSSDAMADATTFTPDTGRYSGLSATGGGIEINIYPNPNQSAREIAEEVRRSLIKEENRRRLAWI